MYINHSIIKILRSWSTTMLLDMLRKYALAGRLQVVSCQATTRNQQKLQGVKVNYKQGWACKQYRNEAGMNPQEDYPTTKNGGKQRQRTILHLLDKTVSCNRCNVAFYSFLFTIFP